MAQNVAKIDVEEVAKRGMVLKASQAVVETIEGGTRLISFPGSNRGLEALRAQLAAEGDLARVTFMDQQGNRLDAMEIMAAAMTTVAAAKTEVSLLTMREIIALKNAGDDATLKHFVNAVTPSWTAAIKATEKAGAGWELAATLSRAEARNWQEKYESSIAELAKLQKRVAELEGALIEAAAEADSKKDLMRERGLEMLGELLSNAVDKLGGG